MCPEEVYHAHAIVSSTPPETIAHYRISSKLGEGAMSEVYRAVTGNNRQLTWFDRRGDGVGRPGERAPYGTMKVSPDRTKASSCKTIRRNPAPRRCVGKKASFSPASLNRLEVRDKRVDATSGRIIRAMGLPAENCAPDRHCSITMGSRSTPFDNLAQAFAREHASIARGIRRQVGDRPRQLRAQRPRAPGGLAVAAGAIRSKELSAGHLPGLRTSQHRVRTLQRLYVGHQIRQADSHSRV